MVAAHNAVYERSRYIKANIPYITVLKESLYSTSQKKATNFCQDPSFSSSKVSPLSSSSLLSPTHEKDPLQYLREEEEEEGGGRGGTKKQASPETRACRTENSKTSNSLRGKSRFVLWYISIKPLIEKARMLLYIRQRCSHLKTFFFLSTSSYS